LTNSPTAKYQYQSSRGSDEYSPVGYNPKKLSSQPDEIIQPRREGYAFARSERLPSDTISKPVKLNSQSFSSIKLRNPMFADFDYSKHELQANRRSNISQQDSLDQFKQHVQDKSPTTPLRNNQNQQYNQSFSNEKYASLKRESQVSVPGINNYGGNGFNQRQSINQKFLSSPVQSPKNQLFYIPEKPNTFSIPDYKRQNPSFERNQNQRFVLDPITQSPLLRNHGDLKRPQYPEVFGIPNMKSEFTGFYS